MTGSGYEILGSDLLDEESPSSSRWPWDLEPRALVGLGLVVALIIGGIVGVGWERQRAHANPTFAVSAVISDGTGLEVDGLIVTQQVQVAVVNAGPVALDNVKVAWQDGRTRLSNEGAPEVVGTIQPGRVQETSLQLAELCSVAGGTPSGDPPQMLVTATTHNGGHHRVALAPVGIEKTWATMAASCPDLDAIKAPTVIFSTRMTEVLPRGADFKVTFKNPNATDILISGVRLTDAKGTTITPFAGSLQVFPVFSGSLIVRISVLDCKMALLDGTAGNITFEVADAASPTKTQTISTRPATFDQALGGLLFRSCGHA